MAAACQLTAEGESFSFLLVLILHRKTCHMPKELYNSIILGIQHVHGDLCKNLGIDSSTDPEGMAFFDFL